MSTGTSTLSDDIRQYLETTCGNADPDVHKGILKALSSVYGKDIKVDHLKAFGEEGVKTLAASVQAHVKKQRGRAARPHTMLHVTIPHHQTAFDIKWRLGESLLDAAKNHEDLLGEYMEGTCGGNMSCCTCHVYIEQPEFQSFLSPPEEAELDMLVSAYSSLLQ